MHHMLPLFLSTVFKILGGFTLLRSRTNSSPSCLRIAGCCTLRISVEERQELTLACLKLFCRRSSPLRLPSGSRSLSGVKHGSVVCALYSCQRIQDCCIRVSQSVRMRNALVILRRLELVMSVVAMSFFT